MPLFQAGAARPAPRPLRLLLALASLALVSYGVLRASAYLGSLAGYPHPVESREENQVFTARALSRGLNPWSPGEAPRSYNPHGVLYAWTAARLLPFADLDVLHCRRLSLAALLLAALLLGLAAARLSGSVLAGAAAGLASLGGYLCFVIPTARVDAFAALFFVAPLALYACAGGGRRDAVRLALCAALAALAFLVKPYAAFSGPLLGLVLLAEGRRKAAVAVWALWALATLALLAAVERAFPGYLECTAFLQARAVGYSWSYLLLQCRVYAPQAALPLALALAALLGFRPLPRRSLAWTLPALGSFLLLLWMGLNPGNFLVYFLELLHPCLVLAAAALWAGRAAALPWLELGLALASVVNVRFGSYDERRFERIPPAVWAEAEGLADSARHPLFPPFMDGLAMERGEESFDNGNLEFLADASGAGATAAALRAAHGRWTGLWARDLARRSVDLVVVDPNAPVPAPLLAGYALVGRLALPDPVDLGRGVQVYDVYRPRPSPGRRRPAGPSPGPGAGPEPAL